MVDLGREEKNSPERQGVRVRKPALGNESVGREEGVETFQKIPEQRERLEGWRRDMLQSVRSQRVRHDLVTEQQTDTLVVSGCHNKISQTGQLKIIMKIIIKERGKKIQ